MGYIEADNLKLAKMKVARAVKRYNKRTNFPNRAIVYVKATRNKGLYYYQTRERK